MNIKNDPRGRSERRDNGNGSEILVNGMVREGGLLRTKSFGINIQEKQEYYANLQLCSHL